MTTWCQRPAVLRQSWHCEVVYPGVLNVQIADLQVVTICQCNCISFCMIFFCVHCHIVLN